ncbi:MAG TPA: hypothetical protein GXX30_01110 [Firmicutes bacterium]|uniref:DUF1640 domain-containing protein n=1 Tax=Candidatus Fermentithermobacillus carboniphilus TaxID=3085328 RepID=A0AAT9LDE9_9FIRM|nr:MAG: hypothetical protein IMF26_01340 [Candidatus Fermentithermobacillus carboniphilus]HHW17492.1 hypothetical protein [Candidatus Fermentithermobacillaceae bacterium]
MVPNVSGDLAKYFSPETAQALVTFIEQTVDKRFEQLKKTEIDHKFEVHSLEHKTEYQELKSEITRVEQELKTELAKTKAEIERAFRDILKWIIVLIVGNFVGLVGVLYTIVK